MDSNNALFNLVNKLKENETENDLGFEKTMVQMRFMSEVDLLMEEFGMSKTELAKAVGLSPSYITQLFKGTKSLNLEMIAKFQMVFGRKFFIEARTDVTKPIQEPNEVIVPGGLPRKILAKKKKVIA